MEQQELQLSHYLKVLLKGKWVILLTTLVALVGVVGFTELQPEPTPSFLATATVKVDPVSAPAALLNASSILSADRSLNTEIQLIGSRNVIERALTKLQPDSVDSPPEVIALQVARLQKDISVRSVPNTNLLELRARADNPELAQDKADAVVEAYIDYVKDVRTGAIAEALDDIRAQLEGADEPNGPGNNQLAVLLPSLGSELEAIARSVEKTYKVITELQGQQNPEAVGLSLSQEVRQMERAATELNSISLDLQRISGDVVSGSQQSPSGPEDALSQHASRLERTSTELDVVYDQIDEIRTGVKNLDPSRAFESAISRSEDAQVVLRRVPTELSGIKSSTVDASKQLNSIESYVESVIDELHDTSTRLRNALAGDDLTQSEKILLRGQMLSNTLGLATAADNLENLRAQARVQDYDGTDISKLSAAEGDIRTAVNQINLLSSDLDAVALTSSLYDGLTQSLDWIRESSRGLLTVSNDFLQLDSSGDPQLEEDISARASIELEDIALTLGVASGQLRSLQPGINDPLLNARLSSATTRLTSSQSEITSVSARLSGGSTTQTLGATLDGLRIVGERIQGNAEVLSSTLDFLQPTNHVPSTVLDANSAVQAYSNTAEVVLSLDIATRQLQSLMRGSFEPLLSGELGTLSDRLLLSYGNVKDISDRLASLASEDPIGQPSGGLSAATFRLESAVIILQSAAESAQSGIVLMDSSLLPDAADKFKEQTDGGIAILGLVANDLTSIQMTETAPVRYGKLAAAAENIRLAQNQAVNLSSQLQQFQEVRGTRYFELQQLRANLELALLQPQETGITLVDSPVAVTPTISKSGLLSKIKIPAGAMAGLLLGCMAVLFRDKVDQRVSSPAELRDRLGLAVMGVIPKGKNSSKSNMLTIEGSDAAAFSEALQVVGANLSSPQSSGLSPLLITSPVPREGKTMLAIHLAHTFAQYGRRVLLVDGNLRKPEVASVLDLKTGEGLAEALAQQRSPMDYIVEMETFAVLPGGAPPLNPVELMSSPAMTFFLEQAKRKYDMVIVDGPPVVGFAEVKALARNVDGAVLVIKAESTNIDEVKQSKEELDAAGVTLAGAVLNFTPPEECGHLRHDNYHLGNTSNSAGGLLSRFRRI